MKVADDELLKKVRQAYLDSPNSVDPSWRAFFSSVDRTKRSESQNVSSNVPFVPKDKGAVGEITVNKQFLLDVKIRELQDAYRRFGYLAADLDLLGLVEPVVRSELHPEFHGLSDVSRVLQSGLTVEQVTREMRAVYCGHIGVQFMHLSDNNEVTWLKEKLEGRPFCRIALDTSHKLALLNVLIKVNGLEEFLNTKFRGVKRFSVEGCDTALVALESIIEAAADAGCTDVTVGMSHRGRLNALVNTFGKKYRALFSGFEGKSPFPEECQIHGDVKYHYGFSCERKSFLSEKTIFVRLLHNPSHLDAVDPVLIGAARGSRDFGAVVFPVLLHGDAAFSGQGVVYESMLLEELPNYESGGVIHIILNNQIGFTTPPRDARKQCYPSFIGEAFDIPIFHVNGDDPEAVFYVTLLAAEFRNAFNKSAIIDIVSYRRYGHNEIDEPKFTQPEMYDVIERHKRSVDIYVEQLIKEGIISRDKFVELTQNFRGLLDRELKEAKTYKPSYEGLIQKGWERYVGQEGSDEPRVETKVPKEVLLSLSERLNRVPEGFDVNSKVLRLLVRRKETIMAECDIDWGNGENLAFATILHDGMSVRLAGQDCKRGTFSHRHAVLTSQSTGEELCLLNNISDVAKMQVVATPLSEYAALGFEYGYSLINPKTLVLWEAQFGDFANGAQIIIDQFISSAESKWLSRSGLVMLLPHGYEGQGPEHSSARIERFLQLAADNNMRVVNCTTPANFFHVLRRQVLSEIVRPLIVFSPKSLLRHKMAVSKLEEFYEGSFRPVISDCGDAKIIRRVVFCSGKVYYDLRAELKSHDILLVRVEQLYPVPDQEIRNILDAYRDAEFVWCQEEPKNMGGWSFMFQVFEERYSKKLRYIGRDYYPVPSEGFMDNHIVNQAAIVREAITL
ncbi:2-oxoglutarate dehydrogenase E1 component [Neorickettsia findlayensis]|uniref:2-oxoglutarate dehydrogenase E1 component n=1 Tax=Neorickettsia findlayensis TaxID=2686014 RepID=A0A6P1GAF9_9RICK|nr:2-oxoglutarate dehydrogenase E1 component [Neorickettsia findlayensis]QHD65280.1 2-oxoglutarate dehydrogenase E1 component [Neorickettsia findlayensis]